jgi:hypothetical protein
MFTDGEDLEAQPGSVCAQHGLVVSVVLRIACYLENVIQMF